MTRIANIPFVARIVALILAVIAAVALMAQHPVPSGAPECHFETAAQVLAEHGPPHARGSLIFQVWDVANRPIYRTTHRPLSDFHARFLSALRRSGVETDPVKLLKRNPVMNNQIIIQEAQSWIRPINCLELLLLTAQNERIDILDDPTEFVSFILRSSDEQLLRIYFYSRNEDGIGNVAAVVARVADDRTRGWILVANLHNHNFHLHGADLNGAVAPSVPDAHLYNSLADRYQLQEAWITNGLSTVRIPAQVFGRFQTKP
jgi:hypothetical protein